MDWLKLIASLISVFGSVIGGTYFAIWKIRKERAFEQRLSWCKATLEAVNDAGFTITAAKTVKPNDPNYDEVWSGAERAYTELLKACGMKEVFAPKEAVTAINEFASAYRRMLSKQRDQRSEDDCDTCMTELRSAAKELITAGRSHLGMEPLPDGLINNDVRYEGYYLPTRD